MGLINYKTEMQINQEVEVSQAATSDELLNISYKSYHEQNYHAAINILESIRKKEKKPSFWILSRLSSCYYELKEYEKALEFAKMAYKENKRSPF